MKFLRFGKDGGPESTVSGFWLVEIKSLFSVVLLRFSPGTREAFHSHAFNSISWVLKGKLHEMMMATRAVYAYRPSFKPVVTTRDNFHKVASTGTTWVLSFRGPWSKTWLEYDPKAERFITLADGRKEV